MAELRRDPIIGQWVIVERDEHSLKPEDYPNEKHSFYQEEICQFCPGRENYTPWEIDAIRPSGSTANTPGWKARVFPNKFPALKIEGDLDKRGIGIYDVSNGIGAHEVLVETPDHRRQLADLSIEEIDDYLRLCRSRCLGLEKDKRFKYIMIFKNHGESAGASVEHAHTQIIALPLVPKAVLAEIEGAKNYYDFRGRCVYCDMIEQEYEDKERIVTDNESFIAFCPFAPKYPFESWIVPKEHESQFCAMNDQERKSLAVILKELLSRAKKCLSDPSYNFYLHISPVNSRGVESYHWHIEFIPQLTREAGYEWGTGLYLVPTSPAMAAKYLRETQI